jgi:hypothetical protein
MRIRSTALSLTEVDSSVVFLGVKNMRFEIEPNLGQAHRASPSLRWVVRLLSSISLSVNWIHFGVA